MKTKSVRLNSKLTNKGNFQFQKREVIEQIILNSFSYPAGEASGGTLQSMIFAFGVLQIIGRDEDFQ